jgi:hypothetical protein
LTKALPWVDPTRVSTRSKVSLELIGEFFELRTQVDRDLTIVSRVDRRLGLIKNLGRHMNVEDYKGSNGCQYHGLPQDKP